MGARGPLAKREGRVGHTTPVTAQVFDVAPTAPPVPEGLHAAVTEQWLAFWQSEASHVLADSDLPAVERLFRYRSEWWETEEDWRRMDDALRITTGSQGQLKIHPLAERILKLEATITALEDKLGLTPRARAQLGIAIGQYKLTWQEVAAGQQKAIEGGTNTPVLDTDDLGV